MSLSTRPNLVLITIDCLRADHTGWHGYPRATTPFLDQLAAQGMVLENAIAAGLPTYFSFPTILAGRYPLTKGRDFTGLTASEATLASTLNDAGYATGAFVAGNPYAARWAGYAQGFDTFEDWLQPINSDETRTADSNDAKTIGHLTRINEQLRRWAERVPGGRRAYDDLYFRYTLRVRAREYQQRGWERWRAFPSAETVTTRALEWVTQQTHKPFFLWVHYMDAHRPYFPSDGQTVLAPQQAFEHYNFWIRKDVTAAQRVGRLTKELALYDAAIRDVDREIQRLADLLQAQGQWDKMLLAVTADHGEAFLEQGESDHDPVMLHQALTHVPLLIHGQGLKAQCMPFVFSQIDLAPTLLDFLDVPSPLSFAGTSRAAELRTSKEWKAIAITEVVHGRTRDQILRGRAMRAAPRLMSAQTERAKIVLDFSVSRIEFYDLANDPAEEKPLPIESQRKQAVELLRALRDHLKRQCAQPYSRSALDIRLNYLGARLAQKVKDVPTQDLQGFPES